MTEQQIEILERYFPNGVIAVVRNPNGRFQIMRHDKNDNPVITRLEEILGGPDGLVAEIAEISESE